MRGETEDLANTTSRTQSGRRAAVAALLLVCTVAGAGASSSQNRLDRRSQDRLEELRRREGEALLSLADAAMAGRAPSDFSIAWSNDFFKAQTGTFVPFTVTIDRSALSAADALMYVRAARRDGLPVRASGREPVPRSEQDHLSRDRRAR